MANPKLIIAPYDSMALGRKSGIDDLLLVYFEKKQLRPITNSLDRQHEVIFIAATEHDEACYHESESLFATAILVDVAEIFSRGKSLVYLLMPEAFVDAFFDVASKLEGRYFSLEKQRYGHGNDFDPAAVFGIFSLVQVGKTTVWDFVPVDQESRKRLDPQIVLLKRFRRLSKTGAKSGVSEEQKKFDPEEAFRSLAQGTLALEALELSDLRKLLDKCLDERRFDLTKIVDSAVAEKENVK